MCFNGFDVKGGKKLTREDKCGHIRTLFFSFFFEQGSTVMACMFLLFESIPLLKDSQVTRAHLHPHIIRALVG